MRYTRIFHLTSCHFNNGQTYERVERARILAQRLRNDSAIGKLIDTETVTELRDLYESVILDSHGHNFKVVVEVDGHMPAKENWLIDDMVMERVVNQFNNVNLSVLEEFCPPALGRSYTRATTEQLSMVIAQAIHHQCVVGKDCAKWVRCIAVEVYETEQQFASYQLFCDEGADL